MVAAAARRADWARNERRVKGTGEGYRIQREDFKDEFFGGIETLLDPGKKPSGKLKDRFPFCHVAVTLCS